MSGFSETMNNLLRKVRGIGKPHTIDASAVTQRYHLSAQDKEMLGKLGVSMNDLTELMYRHTLINYDRYSMYQECERSLSHALMGAAVELYADVSATFSQMHGATVWITAKDRKYAANLNALLDHIGLEERIFDWAWTTATFGDLFIKVESQPGLGIIAVDDSMHPLNTSRLDLNGRLVGFFETPIGGHATEKQLLPPWDYVHSRILGARRKRPVYGDPQYAQYASVNIMSQDKRRVSTKYGNSVLTNALGVYKRLRLAEDSIMLARLSKGVLRYLYKVKIDGSNAEAAGELIDQYKTILKRARAIDTGSASPYFDERPDPLGVADDIILPVWGDVNDLAVEKLGGETDIRWIRDVEELRNQLASALRVPLQLLGGYPGEMPQGLGRGAIERYDIRFARQARRVQRANIDTVTRLCQIHLALQGMNPSTEFFTVNMTETSSAEEEELKEGLTTGIDAVEKVVNVVSDALGDKIDKLKLLDYLNKKFLRLDDLDLTSMLKEPIAEALQEAVEEKLAVLAETRQRVVMNTDFKALLPIKEGKNEQWTKEYSGLKIKATAVDIGGKR